MTKEKADGLDNGHHGEDDTDSTGGGVALEHTDKVGICHVVKRGNQHADDAGDRQSADQFAYRGFGHLPEFQFLFIFQDHHLNFK